MTRNTVLFLVLLAAIVASSFANNRAACDQATALARVDHTVAHNIEGAERRATLREPTDSGKARQLDAQAAAENGRTSRALSSVSVRCPSILP